jgi:hypothetical protein
MSESHDHPRARTARPAFLAVGLFLLAPLVAEYLLGNLPITAAGSLVVLAPLYGGGALLIREVARRLGRGWPTLLVWGVAYALLEEGIVTMSLFNRAAGQPRRCERSPRGCSKCSRPADIGEPSSPERRVVSPTWRGRR